MTLPLSQVRKLHLQLIQNRNHLQELRTLISRKRKRRIRRTNVVRVSTSSSMALERLRLSRRMRTQIQKLLKNRKKRVSPLQRRIHRLRLKSLRLKKSPNQLLKKKKMSQKSKKRVRKSFLAAVLYRSLMMLSNHQHRPRPIPFKFKILRKIRKQKVWRMKKLRLSRKRKLKAF